MSFADQGSSKENKQDSETVHSASTDSDDNKVSRKGIAKHNNEVNNGFDNIVVFSKANHEAIAIIHLTPGEKNKGTALENNIVKEQSKQESEWYEKKAISRKVYSIPSLSQRQHIKKYQSSIYNPGQIHIKTRFVHPMEKHYLDNYDFPEFDTVLSTRNLSAFEDWLQEERLVLKDPSKIPATDPSYITLPKEEEIDEESEESPEPIIPNPAEVDAKKDPDEQLIIEQLKSNEVLNAPENIASSEAGEGMNEESSTANMDMKKTAGVPTGEMEGEQPAGKAGSGETEVKKDSETTDTPKELDETHEKISQRVEDVKESSNGSTSVSKEVERSDEKIPRILDNKYEPRPQLQPVSQHQSQPKPQSQPQHQPQPVFEPKPQSQHQSQPQHQPQPQPQPQHVSQPQPHTEPKIQPQPQPQPVLSVDEKSDLMENKERNQVKETLQSTGKGHLVESADQQFPPNPTKDPYKNFSIDDIIEIQDSSSSQQSISERKEEVPIIILEDETPSKSNLPKEELPSSQSVKRPAAPPPDPVKKPTFTFSLDTSKIHNQTNEAVFSALRSYLSCPIYNTVNLPPLPLPQKQVKTEVSPQPLSVMFPNVFLNFTTTRLPAL